MKANLRNILMPLAILLGVLLPQFHFLSPIQPFLIGLMMFLTFVSSVPKQKHGFTFRIEMRATISGFLLVAILWALTIFFHWPKEFLLAGILICLCPPANAAPAMAKILGGNPTLMLKIFIVGHLIACFSIPLVFSYFSSSESMEMFSKMSYSIFNTMQPLVTIPLALALGLRAFYPEVADTCAKFQKYTIFIWTFSVFVILSHASYQIRAMENLDLKMFVGMAALSAILCFCLFMLGWYTERGEHPIEASQSMGQKNTTLIIVIAQAFAKDSPFVMLGPIWYVIWQNLVLSYMTAKIPKLSKRAKEKK